MDDVNATLEVIVAENRMKAIVHYTPPRGNGALLSFEEIMVKLYEAGVTTGIIETTVHKIAASELPLKNIVAALAIKPETGEKARIETYFEMNHRRTAVDRGDGSVDFHELGEINSAREGQELYRRIPPTLGHSGSDVKGIEIPGLPGRDLRLVLGPGTKRDVDDENLVRAAVSGEIIVQKGIVQVSEVHRIAGDVDFSTGNVDFRGSIKIKGSVKSGFKVKSECDVEIQGNVEDAEVRAGNDIIIIGGFIGSGQGLIKAGRDVIVKFVENQRIEAERDIIVHGASYHAMLTARRAILAQGPKSMIVGGQAQAKHLVQSSRLGSEATTLTLIRVGVDPSLTELIRETEEDIRTLEKSERKLEQSASFLNRQKTTKNSELPPEKQEILDKLETTRNTILCKLDELRARLAKMEQEPTRIDDASVTADTAVFPKVRICFGTQCMNVEDKLGPSVFKLNQGEVIRLSK